MRPEGKLVLREFRETDRERLEEIVKSAWKNVTIWKILEDMFGKVGGKDWWYYKLKPLIELAKNDPERVIIAEYDGIVAGYATYSIDKATLIGTVGENAVDPNYGGKGIGSAMHREVLKRMKQAGMKIAKVTTGLSDDQLPARKLYEKHGFKEIFRSITYVMDLADERF